MNTARGQFIVLLFLSALLVGCARSAALPDKGGAGPVTTIELSMAAGDAHSLDVDRFVEAAKQESRGSLVISVKYDWRQGEPNYEVDLIRDVQAGKANLGIAGARAFDGIGVRSFQPLVAPLLIDSYDLQRRVLESETAAAMLGGLDSAGLRGLGYLAGPLRRPIGFTQSFTSPADFAGAKFGLRASEVHAATLRALGAEPVVPDPGDKSGLDGMEGSLATVNEYIDRSVHSFTGNIVLWPRMDVLFGNAESIDRLSDEQRAALSAAATKALESSDRNVQATGTEIHGVVCNLGVRFVEASDEDMAAFARAVEPVYADLEKDTDVAASIAAIRELRGSTANPEVVPPCPRGKPSNPPGQPTPIDGVWTTSFSRDELVNSPLLLDSGEINDQNWGDFRLELSHGRVTFTQHNDIDNYTTSGQYTVDGNDVTFRFLTGGNRGETFLYRWSLFEGTLSFERHPRMPISPTPYVLKPWTLAP